MPQTKNKKVKQGKINRHKLRTKLGVKKGFGKPWKTPSVLFRVEFNWCDEHGEESNEQIHWVECRKFQGEEYQFLKLYYRENRKKWIPGETLESAHVKTYVSKYLIENRKKLKINQAFIYVANSKKSDVIREPIYKIATLTDKIESWVDDPGINVTLENAVYHHPN